MTEETVNKPRQVLDLKKANDVQINNMNKNMNDKNNKAEDLFSNEREKWSVLLNPIYVKIGQRNPSDYVVVDSERLSIRAQLQESISYHSNQLSKAMVSYKNAYGERMEFYMHGFGIKVNTGEKTKLVDRDLAEAKRRCELLEVHIEFLRECRVSCDQIGFALKNLTALLDYTRTDG
jgi:hypothetical protein